MADPRVYPIPKLSPMDIIKGVTLSTPMLAAIVFILTATFAWWLLPFCLIPYCALTYHLSNEMMISRYIKKNRDWLLNLVPNNNIPPKVARLPFIVEAIFCTICFAVGLGVFLGLGSPVGLLMVAYPFCHAVGRSLSFKQRDLLPLFQFGSVATAHEISKKVKFAALFVVVPLIILAIASPPGLIVLGGSTATMMLINLFCITMSITINIQLGFRGSVINAAHTQTHNEAFAEHRRNRLNQPANNNVESDLEERLYNSMILRSMQYEKKNKKEYKEMGMQTDEVVVTKAVRARRLTI